jgi:RNase H-like domain found in reverse transcriptase
MKKDKKLKWIMECQDAFDTLKKQFTEEPVLLMHDQSKPFQIESDTSKVATSTVLTQLDSNGDQHPNALMSKTFSDTKRKYEVYDQELLGII